MGAREGGLLRREETRKGGRTTSAHARILSRFCVIRSLKEKKRKEGRRFGRMRAIISTPYRCQGLFEQHPPPPQFWLVCSYPVYGTLIGVAPCQAKEGGSTYQHFHDWPTAPLSPTSPLDWILAASAPAHRPIRSGLHALTSWATSQPQPLPYC